MSEPLSLPRLLLLRELQRLGTMAEVARARSLSASAVSQQLAQLEREARVPLLVPQGRRVLLTDAGRALARRAEEMLALSEVARAELAATEGEVSGVLRVASFQTPLIALAPVALGLLERDHPRLEVEIAQLEVEPAYEALLAQQVDVILGEDYPGGQRVVRRGTDREHLLQDPLLAVLPASGPLGRVARLSELADAPWALDPELTRTGVWSRTYLRSAGIEPRVRFAMTDPLLQAHLVRSGHAVALLPGIIASEHLGGTRPMHLPGDPHRSLYTAARAGSAGHPALTAFRSALLEAAGRVTRVEGLESLLG